MDWSNAISEYVKAAEKIKPNKIAAPKIIHLMDLTSLNDSDTEASIASFCLKALTPLGPVASVIVYPQFVRLVAAEYADTQVKVGTVANFPRGDNSVEDVLAEINRGLESGAQEIDVVFPYKRYLARDKEFARTFVEECKAACGEKVILKVILETGVLKDLSTIADASRDALFAGADFIKSSTGKNGIEGATLSALAVMLLVTKEMSPKLQGKTGVKASGGIREFAQAVQYLALADHIMGKDWVGPDTFRLGASQLLDDVLKHS